MSSLQIRYKITAYELLVISKTEYHVLEKNFNETYNKIYCVI